MLPHPTCSCPSNLVRMRCRRAEHALQPARKNPLDGTSSKCIPHSNFGWSCAISRIFLPHFQLLLCWCAKCFRTSLIASLVEPHDANGQVTQSNGCCGGMRELPWHKRGFSPIHNPFHPGIYDRHNVPRNAALWKSYSGVFDWPWQMKSSLFIIRYPIQHSAVYLFDRAHSSACTRKDNQYQSALKSTLWIGAQTWKIWTEYHLIIFHKNSFFPFREELAMKIGLTEARIQVSLSELGSYYPRQSIAAQG